MMERFCEIHGRYMEICESCSAPYRIAKLERELAEVRALLAEAHKEQARCEGLLDAIDTILWKHGCVFDEDQAEHMIDSHTSEVPSAYRYTMKLLKQVEGVITEYHKPLLEKIEKGMEEAP